jgi:hypothetical protein
MRNPIDDKSLSVRLRNVCHQLALDDEKKLEDAIVDGRMRCARNVGDKTIDEAMAWLKLRSFDGMENGGLYRVEFGERTDHTRVGKRFLFLKPGEDAEVEPMKTGQCLVLDPLQWPVGTCIEIYVPPKEGED